MKNIYRNRYTRYNIYYNMITNLYCNQINQINKVPGNWVNFNIPIYENCSLFFSGKLIKRSHKHSNLNQSITIISRISKEKVQIKLTLQYKYIIVE